MSCHQSLPQASEVEYFINKKINFSVYFPVTAAFDLEILTLFITRKHLKIVVVKFVNQRFGSCLMASFPDFIRQSLCFLKSPTCLSSLHWDQRKLFQDQGNNLWCGSPLKIWLINLYFQLCEQEKYPLLNWRKNLSKFNLLVFHSQAEDIQKEVILRVFTLFRSGDFNTQMCFKK